MKPLSNPRHEAFVQARLSGMPVMEAYHSAGYVGILPQLASKISQHPDVKARLLELHNAAGRALAYERLDLIKDLVAIIKAPPADASQDNPLCETRTGRHGEYHRFPSKLRAMARLARIMGWDEPLKAGLDALDTAPDRMPAILEQIRGSAHLKDGASVQDPEQKELPCTGLDDPLTPLQEAFAQHKFLGMGVLEAYQAAGYTGDSPRRASRVNCHPPVQARIAQLRKAAEDALPYKKHEIINDLITMIHASPCEANANNPMCETRMGHEGPCYRFPCKLAAIMQLARLMGWNEPVKLEAAMTANAERPKDTQIEFPEEVRPHNPPAKFWPVNWQPEVAKVEDAEDNDKSRNTIGNEVLAS